MSIGLKITDKKRFRPVLSCGPSRTKSEFKDECNINKLMARYERIGIPDPIKVRFADVSAVPDLQDAFAIVHQAETDFMQVPAHIRKRFNHNPADFVAFLADRENDEEAIKLGLKVKPPQDEAVKVSEAGASSPASGTSKEGK